tara:strand:+ start:2628 stop:4448 length:1821 start_codon:yes stop_codon:yes gene_type:complete
MAEVALPLLVLGGLYIHSNKKDNTKKKESYTNMGVNNSNNLPNTNVKNENFPILKPIEHDSKNYIREYINPNQTTDKFFDGKSHLSHINVENINYRNSVMNNEINSMSGNKINNKDFKHNNMVPFFGSKITGPRMDSNYSESILDSHQGSGSQQIKKVEQAPLFKPEDNVQHNHGMPNNSEFLLSRQIPSNKIANVLPWEQEKVAPGLGLGYTTEGAGGFNSGMLDRTTWKPPTVDELRVKTNPKISYDLNGHQGPAESKINNLPVIGTVEKYRPNTDYALGPERWFTTANVLGQSQIPETILPDNNRLNTTNEYYGVGGNAGDSKASYYKGNYEQSSRPELSPNDFNHASAQGQGSANIYDYGMKGYNISNNNRNSNCQPDNSSAGGINGTFRAIMAPIVDALRPSKKENVIGNSNQTGNVTALVPNLPITNPNNSVKTTIKETTVDKIGLNHLNVSHISVPEGGYQNSQFEIKDQERNFGDSSSMGYVNGPQGQMNTVAWNNQSNNVNKTYENWPMPGGTQIFNGSENIQFSKNDKDRVNNRLPSSDNIIQKNDLLNRSIPSLDTYGKINLPQQYNNEVNEDRINPDILSAFKTNPYAQSLQSY